MLLRAVAVWSCIVSLSMGSSLFAAPPEPSSAQVSAQDRIEKALSEPAAFLPFNGTLKQLRDVLAEKLKVPVYLDARALKDEGVEPTVPIKFDVTGISGKAALRWMLGKINLTWAVRDEVLWITSSERVPSNPSVRVYPVTDLMNKAPGETADFQKIIHLVTSTAAPESWDVVGGAGSIRGITIKDACLLVVSQTRDVHEDLSETLKALRKCETTFLQPWISTAREERIYKALAQPTTFTPFDGTLKQFRKKLQQELKIPVLFDRRALDDVGTELETRMKSSAKGISGRGALKHVLGELDLTWVIDREILLITTIDSQCFPEITRIYPVSDLVRSKDKADRTRIDYKKLIELIESAVSPESWDEVGGAGSVQGFTSKDCDRLIVFQSPDAHEQITELLTMLRGSLGIESKKYLAPPSAFAQLDAAAKKKIEAALALPAKFTPFDGTLRQLRDVLQKKLKVPVYLDKRALDDEGIDPAAPIKLDVTGISGQAALNIILGPIELTWTIKDGVLWITTNDNAYDRLEMQVYPVTDLMDKAPGETADFDMIIELVTSTAAPASWDSVGGPGSIRGITIQGADLLVVSQFRDVHEDLSPTLKALRKCEATFLPPWISTAGEKRIRKALAQPATFTPFDGTFKQFRKKLQQELKIPVQLDRRGLDDVGIGLETRMKSSLKGISGRGALNHMLGEFDLTWVIESEILLITTIDSQCFSGITRIYPVRDLVRFKDKAGRTTVDYKDLMKLIAEAVSPESWDEVGSSGMMQRFTVKDCDRLVVSQTPDVHEDMTELLTMLRGSLGIESKKYLAPPSAFAQLDAAAKKKIEAALALPAKFTPFDGTLRQLRDVLQKTLNIPVDLDARALANLGLDLSTKLKFDVTGISGKSALDAMLAEHKLGWTIKNEMLSITWDEESNYTFLDTRIYRVTDLTRSQDENKKTTIDFDTVIQITTSFVARSSWDKVGGYGSIQSFTFKETDLLVVHQTDQHHKQLAQLLSALRKGETATLLSPDDLAAGETIDKALAGPVAFTPFEGTLAQFREVLQEKLKVNVHLDVRHLSEGEDGADFDRFTSLQLSLTGISNRAALDTIFHGWEWDWTVRSGAVWITTRIAAENMREVCMYSISDLFSSEDDATDLIDVITSAVAHNWLPGTPGGIQIVWIADRMFLTVEQTHSSQRQIAEFLATLRAYKSGTPPPRSLQFAAREKINKALSQPVAFTPFRGTLRQLRQSVQEKLKVPVYLDIRALNEVGLDPASAVDFDLAGISGKSALDLILHDFEMSWTIKHEALWLTTVDYTEVTLDVRVYPVTDLVRRKDPSGGTTVDFDSLLDLLALTVTDNGWDGGYVGTAQAITISNRDLLVVSQARRVHERIAKLLEKLRAVQAPMAAEKAKTSR